jgi:hypothetical protein
MNKMIMFALTAFLASSLAVGAQEVPTQKSLEGLYPGKTSSPYANRAFPGQVFWGDSHVHTAISLDAGLFGNTIGPDGAYRLVRGEQITSSTGLPVKLDRPLDRLVVADHSDMMGFASDIRVGAPAILKCPKGKEWYDGMQKGGSVAGAAAFDLINHFAQMKLPKE